MRLISKAQEGERLDKTRYDRNVGTDLLGMIENSSRWPYAISGYKNGRFYPKSIGGTWLVGYGTVISQNPKTKAKLEERGNGDPEKGWLTKEEALNTANYDLKAAMEKIRKDAIKAFPDEKVDTISSRAWLPLAWAKYHEGNVGGIYKDYTRAALDGDEEAMRTIVQNAPLTDNNVRKLFNDVKIYQGIYPQRKL